MKSLKVLCYTILSGVIMLSSCTKSELSSPLKPIATLDTNATDLVNTPFGWIPRANVHLVEEGSHLRIQNNHVYKMRDGTNEQLDDFGTRMIPILNAFQRRHFEPNPYALSKISQGKGDYAGENTNWLTYAQFVNTTGTPISNFSTTWIVPTNPTTNHGQTLYIFNGMEVNAGTDIIQPVLQWGTNPYGGGINGWEVANWYVWTDANGNSQASVKLPKVEVYTSNSLQGVITLVSAGASYVYTSSFPSLGNTLTVENGADPNQSTEAMTTIAQQTAAYETLEAYSGPVGSPPPLYSTDYPPDFQVKMTNITIGPAAVANYFDFNTYANTVNNFGESTTIVNNSANGGEVDINFHPNNALINGQTSYYFSSTQDGGGGQITAAGPTVSVTVSAGGPPPGNYTTTFNLNSAYFTDGTSSIDVSSGTVTKTLVMPSSHSTGWTGNFSESNNDGSGGISVK